MANPKRPTGADEGADKFHVVLRAPDEEAVAGLLADHALDVGLMKRDRATKEVSLVLFLTQREIERFRDAGFALDVRENLSEVGRRRQKEVGSGDRFHGGKVAPTGLGKKTPKRR